MSEDNRRSSEWGGATTREETYTLYQMILITINLLDKAGVCITEHLFIYD